MHGELVVKELEEKVKEGKGCIVIDFGSYLKPTKLNVLDNLNLRLWIDGLEIKDYKLNHRYPNKYYTTLSKKAGRNVSKIGYPYFLEPEDFNRKMDIQLEVSIVREADGKKEILETTTIIMTVQLNLDKESSACGLTLHYLYGKKDYFRIFSWQSTADGGWVRKIWTSRPDDFSDSHMIEDIKAGEVNRIAEVIAPCKDKYDKLYL